MTVFEVWAPGHDSVEVVIEAGAVESGAVESGGGSGAAGPIGAVGVGQRSPSRVPMVEQSGGWWRVDVPDAGPGTGYRFSLDGGDPRPDPRSAWQPDGVDGPSVVVDHRSFEWHDGAWKGARLASAVLYELHVGTFTATGTFAGVIEHLDALVDVGVTAIELLPVAEYPGEWGWGYDGVLLWAPHHAYGGPDGLKRLVDAAHQRGLAVVLDVVYNHLGPAGNYLGEFGPYFTDRYATPWGSAINVDGAGSVGVRDFIVTNACSWFVDYHIDGLRLDAVHAIIDDSALHVLEELATTVDALADHLGRPLWLIAESDRNDPRLVASREAGGFGLAATWNDDFHHALHATLTGERSGYYEDYGPVGLIARCYRQVYAYGRHWSPFRQRHHGRPVGDLPATRFVGYLQNHDQIGNRAVGERSSSLMRVGRTRIGAALVLLGPFVPMLFQGEEWAASSPFQYFTNHPDPELGHAVSEGRRREFAAFGWSPDDVPDPQDPDTRGRSVLDWDERNDGEHADAFRWHRDLLAIRRTYPELTDGRRQDIDVRFDEDVPWLVIRRGRVILVCNLGPEPLDVPAPFVSPGAALEVLLASGDEVAVVDDGTTVAVRVGSDGVAVLALA
jgi:maltooligosyltrehalose trehalohydrolase